MQNGSYGEQYGNEGSYGHYANGSVNGSYGQSESYSQQHLGDQYEPYNPYGQDRYYQGQYDQSAFAQQPFSSAENTYTQPYPSQPSQYVQGGYAQPYSQQYPSYAASTYAQQYPNYQSYQQGNDAAQQSAYQSVPQQIVADETVKPVSQNNAYGHADKVYDKDARRGGIWRVIFILALIVLVTALGIAGYILFSYWNGQHEYDELTQYMQVDEEHFDAITLGSFDVDWDALRAINPDVVGWVYVPDTRINYPIVWREHDDKYYLKRSFGDNSAGDFAAEYGCIMLSGENTPDFSDEVNIIYGHNMRNGSMFEALSHNLDTEYFNAHRVIYLLTPQGNYRLMSYACDRVRGTSTDIVIPNFPTKEEYKDYVQKRIDESTVTPDPAIPPIKDIKQTFAFSTCDYPDNKYRVITFCYADEFLKAGSDPLKGDIVPEGDVSNVEDVVNQRLS